MYQHLITAGSKQKNWGMIFNKSVMYEDQNNFCMLCS